MEIKQDSIGTVSVDTTALVPYSDVSIYKSKVKVKIEKTLKRSIDIFGGIVGARAYLEKEKENMTYFYKYIVTCKLRVTEIWHILPFAEINSLGEVF